MAPEGSILRRASDVVNRKSVVRGIGKPDVALSVGQITNIPGEVGDQSFEFEQPVTLYCSSYNAGARQVRNRQW
jgi:hypothetical protein